MSKVFATVCLGSLVLAACSSGQPAGKQADYELPKPSVGSSTLAPGVPPGSSCGTEVDGILVVQAIDAGTSVEAAAASGALRVVKVPPMFLPDTAAAPGSLKGVFVLPLAERSIVVAGNVDGVGGAAPAIAPAAGCAPEAVVKVGVYFAAGDIPKGTRVADALASSEVLVAQLPNYLFPQDALVDAVGTTRYPIAPGTILTQRLVG